MRDLMWNPGVDDRRGGICQPFKKPPPQRFRTLDDVKQHSATINNEVNRMLSRINAYREGRSEYDWYELKNMCDCLSGQINQLAAAADRFSGREAEDRREFVRIMRLNHEDNIRALDRLRPRF